MIVRQGRTAARPTPILLALILLLLPGIAASPLSAHAQSVARRTPNIEGIWSTPPGRLHFHFLHRFTITDPPFSKVLNSPTFLLAAGLPAAVVLGARYASNSVLIAGEPNEWELFGRWAPVLQDAGGPLDLSIQAGRNLAAESVDGELLVGRRFGPLGVLLSGRAFSAFGGEDSRTAVGAGAYLRLHRWIALAADVAQITSGDFDAAWSAGLQLEVPYTPHSLSLHMSNANTTTLQGSSVGVGDRRWGFEFTVPFTVSRWFGDDDAATAPDSPASAAGEAVVVEMDNRLRFLPDTVRIRAGEAVLWRNSSDVIHTVTADPARAVGAGNVRLPAGVASFDSGDIRPGEEFRHVFDTPGEYAYICVPHELAGMIGVVIVEAGAM